VKKEDFLPSSRNIAFKKSVWAEIGGYPESLDYAEDTIFDINLKSKGYKFTVAEDAIVYWDMRTNHKSLFKQFYNYRKWDAIAGITEFKSTFMYITLFLLFLIFTSYNYLFGFVLI
jgi:hypothetical protein